MPRYVFKSDEPLRIKGAKDADPQRIGDALEAITLAHGGELEPAAVVSAARSSNHPLHQHFEWNDKVAAEAHRLDQARSLIRIIRVEDTGAPEGTTRAFLSVSTHDGVAYHAISEVKVSFDLQSSVLKAAERDLDAFQRRYRDLADVCEGVQKAREALARRMGKQERRAA